jgi:hypothetical protein
VQSIGGRRISVSPRALLVTCESVVNSRPNPEPHLAQCPSSCCRVGFTTLNPSALSCSNVRYSSNSGTRADTDLGPLCARSRHGTVTVSKLMARNDLAIVASAVSSSRGDEMRNDPANCGANHLQALAFKT